MFRPGFIFMLVVLIFYTTQAQEIEDEDEQEEKVINNYYCGMKGDRGPKGEAGDEKPCQCDVSLSVVKDMMSEFKNEIQTLKNTMDMLMCSPPPPVDDPNIICDVKNKTFINTVATYSCINDLRISGSNTRTCGTDLQWSQFEDQAPTCRSKCEDNELLIRGECFFVGDRTTAYTSRKQANKICKAQRPKSHLGYIKSREEYNLLKAYVESYLQEQSGYYGTMYLALGGTYNPMRGGDTIAWADGTNTPSPQWWPGFPRTVQDDSDYKGYTFINMGISGNIDGLYNHFRHESGSKAHVLCQYSHGF